MDDIVQFSWCNAILHQPVFDKWLGSIELPDIAPRSAIVIVHKDYTVLDSLHLLAVWAALMIGVEMELLVESSKSLKTVRHFVAHLALLIVEEVLEGINFVRNHLFWVIVVHGHDDQHHHLGHGDFWQRQVWYRRRNLLQHLGHCFLQGTSPFA